MMKKGFKSVPKPGRLGKDAKSGSFSTAMGSCDALECEPDHRVHQKFTRNYLKKELVADNGAVPMVPMSTVSVISIGKVKRC